MIEVCLSPDKQETGAFTGAFSATGATGSMQTPGSSVVESVALEDAQMSVGEPTADQDTDGQDDASTPSGISYVGSSAWQLARSQGEWYKSTIQLLQIASAIPRDLSDNHRRKIINGFLDGKQELLGYASDKDFAMKNKNGYHDWL